ncbi:Progonadoliberin-2, partial [Ophiophagus hannah]
MPKAGGLYGLQSAMVAVKTKNSNLIIFCRDTGVEDHIMVYGRSLLVFFCIIFAIGLQLTRAQHWSYGWYPGGKREIALPGNLEDSEEIKLCDGQGCPYMKVASDKVAGILTGQLQKKK